MKPKALPDGRTLKYYALRVCERFGQPADWFYKLPNETQANLLAYDEIRRQEEFELLEALHAVK